MLKGRIDTCEDIKEEIQMHFKNLDDSLDEIRHELLVITEAITAINERLKTLETQSSLHTETEKVLVERQATLEQKESHLEEQLRELHMSSSTETDFSQGM